MTTKTINFEGPFSCGPSLQQACNAVSIVLVEARWHGEDVQTWSVDVRGKHSDIIRLKEPCGVVIAPSWRLRLPSWTGR